MTRILRIKLGVDGAMTVLFLLSLGHAFTGNFPHEILGTALAVCFITHNALNAGWYKSLFKGKYTPLRAVLTGVNLLLLLAMLGLCVSGILLSRDVFAFLQLGGPWTARQLHTFFAYWSLVLMGIHVGLNGGLIRAHLPTLRPGWSRFWQGACWLFALYGVYAFFHRTVAQYLFLKILFMRGRAGTSATDFFVQHLAIFFMLAFLTDRAVRFFNRPKHVNGETKHA